MSCFPLKPDNFPYFLAGARKYGPAGKHPECLRCQFRSVAYAGRHCPAPPGIGGESPQTISHGNLLQIVTAPPIPGIVTAVEFGVSITFIKYHPKIKPSAYAPLAPSVTCGDSSLPEGAMGCCVSTLDLWELEVSAVNPSGKNQRFLPAPFGKGAFWLFPFTHPYHPVVEVQADKCPLTPCRLFPARKPLAGSAYPRQISVVFPSGNPKKRVAFAPWAHYNRFVIVNNL